MTIRLHVDRSLVEHDEFALPEGAARHAQVRRVQPGDELHLFDGRGHEHAAQVLEMGRKAVVVRLGPACAALAELPQRITLALGMPANERMDTLVEKATELGVHAIQPLECERSVLRLSGERAQRKREHWQAVAVAASEQCGRAWVPQIEPVRSLMQWLQGLHGLEAPEAAGVAPGRWLLSFGAQALPPGAWLQKMKTPPTALQVLSGPEGGLSPSEQEAARAVGFCAVTLGPRVLRADTAPLALLAWWGLRE
ncbi:MAG: 16S rRNA (uracil(1498)-N(3))-methyltransferase [Betaproteobacteria bacterium]